MKPYSSKFLSTEKILLRFNHFPISVSVDLNIFEYHCDSCLILGQHWDVSELFLLIF